MDNPQKSKTYEECYDVIDAVISKFQPKWRLTAINWFDFEDVKQIIKLHVFKKWHLWDQSKPLEPWVYTVTSHQIKNLIRNNYTNYARPCISCPHNQGEDSCSLNLSGQQDSSCSLYKKWEKSKKQAYSIKLPLTIENHTNEVSSMPESKINFQHSIDKINDILKNQISEKHYQAYIMLFFDNSPDEEVAQFLGFKTSEKKRKAGYKQINNIKKMLKEKIKLIIAENDIVS